MIKFFNFGIAVKFRIDRKFTWICDIVWKEFEYGSSTIHIVEKLHWAMEQETVFCKESHNSNLSNEGAEFDRLCGGGLQDGTMCQSEFQNI